MKRAFLATALLLTSAGLASADYIILTANVGGSTTKELRTAGGPGMGMAGGNPRGGNPRGGPGTGGPGMGPPNAGMRGGPGMGPGAGMGGGPGMGPPNAGMRGGPGMGPGAGMGGGPGMGMMGMRGGAGMMGMGGGPGMGRMGMRGGPGMGMMGGLMGGATADIDDLPYFIVTVVEVTPVGGKDLYKRLTDPRTSVQGYGVVAADHKWGRSHLVSVIDQSGNTSEIPLDVHVLTQEKHVALPTVRHTFDLKFGALKDKPKPEDIIKVAEWALQHGLVDQFPLVMKKLIEVDKNHRAAVAYEKIKPELDKPTAPDSISWRAKLLSGIKVVEDPRFPHFTIVHNATTERAAEVPSHLALLENSFRGFYYWFALRGVALPVPAQRQLVVLTERDADFNRLHGVLTPSPVVVEGFFARRENVTVMSTKRQDESYQALNVFWKKWEDRGHTQKELFASRPKPKQKGNETELQLYEGQMVALMLRALEEEGQRATISHTASRQLLFASDLLPRNVAVPEWLLFGMGSFFETPLQSPWPALGAPSPYYLPRWNDLKNKGFGRSHGDTLREVVTDTYFRALPPEGAAGTPARQAYDHALRRARTSAWALGYFLSRQKLDKLQLYFQELSRLPRDLELDDEVLLTCFARAFKCLDGAGKPDKGKLAGLASEWYSSMENVKFESEGIMKEVRDIFRKKLAASQAKEKEASENQGQIDPRTGRPIQQGGGGNPGGPRPPGGNPRPPN